MAYQKATAGVDGELIRNIPYQPSAVALPIETFSLASLEQRRGRAELSARQRPQFEVLVYCRSGAGSHEVDFQQVALVPGRVLHVRAGQVHRWVLDPPYEAQLIVLRSLDHIPAGTSQAPFIDLDSILERDLQRVLELVDSTGREAPLSIRSLEAARDLIVSLLQLDQPAGSKPTQHDILYMDFTTLLSSAQSLPKTVQACAHVLGCSTRTLARVCASAVGQTPKALLDQAVALEAQRQLSVGGPSIADVAEKLGFVELSNFTRFFRRTTGQTPSQFVATLPPQLG